LVLSPESISYIDTKKQRNKNTGEAAAKKLKTFEVFLSKSGYKNVKYLIHAMTEDQKQVYTVFNKYVSYLQSNHLLNERSISQYVITIKDFLEYYDIEFSQKKFSRRVTIPKTISRRKTPLTKELIQKILNACDGRLKTYVLTLAVTGCRAKEPLTLRIKDINFDLKPAKAQLWANNTKTKSDRTLYLTNELADRLKDLIKHKYRKRRNCRKVGDEYMSEYRTPEMNENDLVFAAYNVKINGNSLYNNLVRQFGMVLDRIGLGQRDEYARHRPRRKITLHSFRHYVFTTVDRLSVAHNFANLFIGHKVSTYFDMEEEEISKIFMQRIEPELTFLDHTSFNKQESDLQTLIKSLESDKQVLKFQNEWYENTYKKWAEDVYQKKLQQEDIIRKLTEEAKQKLEWLKKEVERVQAQTSGIK
jgi:integrase